MNHPRPIFTWTCRPRRGFTFVEIMFAIIILGIGFIMIAGVFPVALQEAETTRKESAGAMLSQSVTRWLQSVAYDKDFPLDQGAPFYTAASGNTPGYYFGPPRYTPASNENLFDRPWMRLRGSMIQASDPRFAWMPLYFRRDDGRSSAELFVFVCESRLDGRFTLADVNCDQNPYANLYPKEIRVRNLFKARPQNGDLADRIEFIPSAYSNVPAPGSFVVVYHPNRERPVVYRLGSPYRELPNLWELDPAYALNGTAEEITNGQLRAFVIGRPWSASQGVYAGPTQDVALYQTSLFLK